MWGVLIGAMTDHGLAFDALVKPVTTPDDAAASALAQAITAALADPESKALAQVLPAAAGRPIFWQPRDATHSVRPLPGP